jgi:hypothetical protein
LRKSTTKRLLEATELWLLEPTEPTELRLLESAEL